MNVTVERPHDVGLPDAAVDELVERAGEEIREGLLPSCQLALARDGRVGAFVALGDASPSQRYPIFSVTKALTASAAWLLIGDGVLTASTRIADVVPEFGTNGKDVVTVEHVMTHTAGFPRAPMRPLEGADREARLARFASWRLAWEPGTRTEYHPTSADWVLAELIARLGGFDDHRRFVAERIAGPLGLPRLQLGTPPNDQADVVDVAVVGQLSEESRGQLAEVVDADAMLAEVRRDHLLRFNDPQVRAAGVPGAGAIGTAADVALFFQALLHDPAGVWDPGVRAAGTGSVLNRHPDPWTRVPANRTLGLVVAGDDGAAVLRGFGSGNGPRAFGTQGVGGHVAWADPDSGLSFCYLTNGLDADPIRSFRRQIAISSRAAACAG